MPKMIELIRQSAVPANVMRTASKGALSLPPEEMIEILVYLATSSIFKEQAKMTLAGWDEASSIAVASSPDTPWEVLNYMVAPENLRPRLVPALLDNPSVREARLVDLAQNASREMVERMLASRRVRASAELLHALRSNPILDQFEIQAVDEALQQIGRDTSEIEAYHEVERLEKTQFEIDHAEEIAAEEAAAKPFVLFGQDDEAIDTEILEAVVPMNEQPTLEVLEASGEPAQIQVQAQVEGAVQVAPATPAAVPQSARPAVPAEAKAKERVSALQKIARMSVGQRIQLAMKGNKEERFILVRDGSRLVSQAVLQSAKVTDAEIEAFAFMKNVQEGVLRDIARNHKFMKNYGVVRSLTSNPRCPLDLSLGLLNHLLVNDLKALSLNKNVPETLRKLAHKRFKEKTETKK